MDLLSFLHLVEACITLHWILSSTLPQNKNPSQTNIQETFMNHLQRQVLKGDDIKTMTFLTNF